MVAVINMRNYPSAKYVAGGKPSLRDKLDGFLKREPHFKAYLDHPDVYLGEIAQVRREVVGAIEALDGFCANPGDVTSLKVAEGLLERQYRETREQFYRDSDYVPRYLWGNNANLFYLRRMGNYVVEMENVLGMPKTNWVKGEYGFEGDLGQIPDHLMEISGRLPKRMSDDHGETSALVQKYCIKYPIRTVLLLDLLAQSFAAITTQANKILYNSEPSPK